uniref:Leucine-rich repeat-containing N-terminal plant-type domain-containing protein n=1 Tax=Solanum lycopersicum TaxID=4081 RepID=A0A3Q7IZN5_SOLLC
CALSHKHQTISLIKFKKSLTINTISSYICEKPYPKTSSWNMSRDCCSWDGVICDNMTGNVIELNLSCSGIVGKIDSNSNLFQLSHLQRLDLSYLTHFFGSHISPEFGRFSNLTYFDLSWAGFSGQIPSEVSHLSKLHSLRLYGCSGLEVLDTHHNNLIGSLQTIFSNNGSSLINLNLHSNKLEGRIPRSLANCKELQLLHLGDNHLTDTFLIWLGTLPKLKVLILRSNSLHGSIQPPRIETIFPKLQILDFSDNAFSGNLPSNLFQRLEAMRTNDPSRETQRYHLIPITTKGFEVRILYLYTVIDFSSNKFEGQIPIESLDLSGNKLSGKIPEQLVSLVSFILKSFPQSSSRMHPSTTSISHF